MDTHTHPHTKLQHISQVLFIVWRKHFAIMCWLVLFGWREKRLLGPVRQGCQGIHAALKGTRKSPCEEIFTLKSCFWFSFVIDVSQLPVLPWRQATAPVGKSNSSAPILRRGDHGDQRIVTDIHPEVHRDSGSDLCLALQSTIRGQISADGANKWLARIKTVVLFHERFTRCKATKWSQRSKDHTRAELQAIGGSEREVLMSHSWIQSTKTREADGRQTGPEPDPEPEISHKDINTKHIWPFELRHYAHSIFPRPSWSISSLYSPRPPTER